MRYHGKGSPLAVLVSCLTLNFFPQILFVIFLLWLPWWAYVVAGSVILLWWIFTTFSKENKNGEK